jgi:hypothetical protein
MGFRAAGKSTRRIAGALVRSSGLVKVLPTSCRAGTVSCGRSAAITSRCGESACTGYVEDLRSLTQRTLTVLDAEPRNIRSLTSLRFFAATMIVVFHSNGPFGRRGMQCG